MFGMRDRLEELEKRVELLEFKEKGKQVEFKYQWEERGKVKVNITYLNHYKTGLIRASFDMDMYDDIKFKDDFIVIRFCYYEEGKRIIGQIHKVYMMTETGLDEVNLDLFRKAYPNEV